MVKICLFNTRSCNLHTVFSDRIYPLVQSCLFCFTETKSTSNLYMASVKKIEDYSGLEKRFTRIQDMGWQAVMILLKLVI